MTDWEIEAINCLIGGAIPISEHVRTLIANLSAVSLEDLLGKDIKVLEKETQIPAAYIIPLKRALANHLFSGYCKIWIIYDDF